MGPDAGSCLFGSKALMSLASALATGAGLAPHGSASVDIIADPLEVLIIHDGWCAGVDQNDLIPLLLAVFGHPVRVKNFHIAEPSAGPLLSDALNGFGHGDGIHAHLAGLSVSLVTRLAQAASSHFNACHDDALLGLVAQSPRPVQGVGLSIFCTVISWRQALSLSCRSAPTYPSLGEDQASLIYL